MEVHRQRGAAGPPGQALADPAGAAMAHLNGWT